MDSLARLTRGGRKWDKLHMVLHLRSSLISCTFFNSHRLHGNSKDLFLVTYFLPFLSMIDLFSILPQPVSVCYQCV